MEHFRKGEMAHHAMRAKHKNAHMSEKKAEYAHHPHMMDNRKLNDNHQQGIERIKQRHGDMEVGQHGKMMAHKGAGFKRNQGGGGLTPRKA